MKHGLIFGKFYPPHLGHQHLISEAVQRCDEVTVLVMAARRETILWRAGSPGCGSSTQRTAV